MREIRFRAWRNDEGYMVTSERGVLTALQHAMGLAFPPRFSSIDNQPKAGMFTLMQYTGLKDKNGVEIYEGDIITMDKNGEKSMHRVKYMDDNDYPAFDLVPFVDCDCNALSYAMAECEIEVIGNIYENPELLEEASDGKHS